MNLLKAEQTSVEFSVTQEDPLWVRVSLAGTFGGHFKDLSGPSEVPREGEGRGSD